VNRVRRVALNWTVVALCVLTFGACGSSSPTMPTSPLSSVTLSSVTLSASNATAGGTVQGTVTLSAITSIATVVSLSSSNTGVTVPASVTIAAGASTGVFTISIQPTATGQATITATLSTGDGTSVTTTLMVAPVNADFMVTPDPGTGANPGQCVVSQNTINTHLMDQLKCTFDASISTPNPGITSYTWMFPSSTGTTTFTGMTLHDIAVSCGSFGAADITITLTVVAPTGQNTNMKTVTFIKANAC
jgi:hypothetical protein